MKNLCYTLLLLSFISSFAQNDSILNFRDETIYRINILLPGLEIEKDVYKDFSVVGNLGLFPGYYKNNNLFSNSEEGSFFIPFIDLQVRYYTNFNRRIEKGKTIVKNTGNFVALKFTNYFGTSTDHRSTESIRIAGMVYGIQRTYWDHWHLNFESGLMANLDADRNDTTVLPWISFQIGYTF